MDPTVLGALVGFFGALVALGIPLLGFLLQLYSDVQTVLGIVTGRDEVDGDGVLARLREIEERLARVEVSVAESPSVDYDQSGSLETGE
jgi:hypothetical protein